jgi:predicted dehydrogenase
MAVRNKVGFAVVGLGNIARNSILPAFANCKKATLVALVSRKKKKAAKLAAEFGAKFWYSLDEFGACLTDPQVSAVYISTPPGEHADLTVRSAQAGKHVLCEKPLAATVAESVHMVDACRQHGVRLMTAYRKYFEPAALCLKKLTRDKRLGRIDMIHTSFSELFTPGVSPAWLLDPVLAGGGPMMDLGVYCVNTTRWLVDEDPIEASAHSWRHKAARFRNVEEGISFRLNFRSGLVVQGSSTYSAAMSSFIFVQGTKGWASLAPAFPFEYERTVTGQIEGRKFERKFRILDEFALEIDAFASAILENKNVEPDGVEGYRDMAILHSIYESARNLRPVAIDYSSGGQSLGA